jgi:hypothetical protein
MLPDQERTPDMARRSTAGSDFVAAGHCTISMKAQVWTRASQFEIYHYGKDTILTT